jgi:tetratricopeptide (TPR) repeat protein
MPHLSDGDVARFLAGRLEPADQQRVVRHLLSGCVPCNRKLVGEAPGGLLGRVGERRKRGGSRDLLDRALDTALGQEARWRSEQQKLAQSLELLRAGSGSYDALSFRQVQALQGPGLVEALLRRSFELRYRDPGEMRWLAYNALKAAEGLRPEEHGQSRVLDEQARSWAELANAYRLHDQLAEADGAFDRARSLLRQGSGDLHLLARVAELEATLRTSQRRLKESRQLFEAASRLYLKLGEASAAGRVLIAAGTSRHYGGDTGQAVAALRHGLSLLDPGRDAQIVSAGRQSLIGALAGADLPQEAGRLLLESGLRQFYAADPLALVKLRWVEGKVLLGLGRVSRAERALVEIRAEYLDLGQDYSASLVALDLVPLWFREGKDREAREAARQAYDVLREIGIDHEAARARRYLE